MADNTQGNQQGSTNSKPTGLSWSQPPKSNAAPLLGGSVAKSSGSSTNSKTSSTPPVGPGSSRGRMFGLFLAGAVVGALLTWGFYGITPQGDIAQNNMPSATSTGMAPVTAVQPGASVATPVIGSTTGIVLPNPQPAGLKVDITSASITVPTWVVVYEVINGARGNALGAGYFTPETGSRSITLLRATEAGKTYWVGKRVDNGDKDFTAEDQPILNAAGQPLYVEFTAR